ncbi:MULTISPECIES: tyrosine-type recombinase/integrase [Mesorhizobium]|uniref:DUF4102 domain-containing protein n=1 Tax=Mesorhizobium denitrificans TaxID=2294114 RepID=A0A371XG01_9HYPH|nr:MULTISPECIES: site-specific integrase [Mesorhizobium]RFC68150.1 DUF4102 domain-containing protein [Mesorhizobium denitrificans]
MAIKLTDTIIKNLPLPAKGMAITYDTEVRGFGIRVTAKGAKSFILNYRTKSNTAENAGPGTLQGTQTGKERRLTLRPFPEWGTVAARKEAEDLKHKIKRGHDPLAKVEADRNAKTVADLCDRFISDYLPNKRPSTIRDYTSVINNEIRPALGTELVATVQHEKIDGLHHKIAKRGAKIRANRTVAVLSKMFSLAIIKWKWRDNAAGNPATGVEKNAENKRKTYLKPAHIAKLGAALDAYPIRERKDGTTYVDARAQQSANVVRLLMLTGARSGELLGKNIVVDGKRFDKEGVRWDQFDLSTGVWTKPASSTKQNEEHAIPLSAPALALLVSIRADAERQAAKQGKPVSEYVFPGRGEKPYLTEIKKAWAEILKAAEITDFRVHDLRHTYASVLVSAGLSLPIIGALLGHSQEATTKRYAHLMDDPLKKATETAGAILTGKPSAEIIPVKGAGQ